MASFGVNDILQCIDIACKLYAFHKTDPQKQYSDFAAEIHDLERHLEKLLRVVNNAAPAADLPPTNSLSGANASSQENWQPKSLEVLTGDFKKTLDSCKILLDDRAAHRGAASYISKIRFSLAVEGPMRYLSERLRSHTLKISLVLEPLKWSLQDEIRHRVRHVEDNTEHIRERTDEIQEAIAHLTALLSNQSSQSSAETIQVPFRQAKASLTVPPQVLEKLESAYEFSDDVPAEQSEMGLDKLINGFIYHFSHGTAHFQADDSVPASSLRDRYLDLMKSIFLLNKMKSCDEYQFKASEDSLWKHYTRSLETMCLKELHRFVVPGTSRSLEQPDVESLSNLQKSEYLLYLRDEESERGQVTGIESMKIIYHHKLISPRPNEEEHELTLLRLSETKLGMQYVTTQIDEPRTSDRIKSSVGLTEACLKPIWMAGLDKQLLCATFIDDCNQSTALNFRRLRHMFRLQQALTAFEVAHHQLNVSVRQSFNRRGTVDAVGAAQIWQEEKLDAEDFIPSSSSMSVRRISSSSRASSSVTFLSNTSTISIDPRAPPPVAPMIVFFLTSEKGERSFLTVTVTDSINAIPKCHCAAGSINCPHLNLEPKPRSAEGFIVQSLSASPNDFPNIASLGLYQNNPRRQPPGLKTVEILSHLELRFATAEHKAAFRKSLDVERDIFKNKSAWHARERTLARNRHVGSFSSSSSV